MQRYDLNIYRLQYSKRENKPVFYKSAFSRRN